MNLYITCCIIFWLTGSQFRGLPNSIQGVGIKALEILARRIFRYFLAGFNMPVKVHVVYW